MIAKRTDQIDTVGAMKIKRHKKIALETEFTKIDKIRKEWTDEHGQKLILIKCKKLLYEKSTFELIKDAMKCEFFEEALKRHRDRKKMRHIRIPLYFKHSKESQMELEEKKVYLNGNKLWSY